MKKTYCDNCGIQIFKNSNELKIAVFYEAIMHEGSFALFIASPPTIVIPSSKIMYKKDEMKTYELCDPCYGSATKAAHEKLRDAVE